MTSAFLRFAGFLARLAQWHGLLEGVAHLFQTLVIEVMNAFAAFGGEVDQLVVAHGGRVFRLPYQANVLALRVSYSSNWRKVRFRRGPQGLRVFAT